MNNVPRCKQCAMSGHSFIANPLFQRYIICQVLGAGVLLVGELPGKVFLLPSSCPKVGNDLKVCVRLVCKASCGWVLYRLWRFCIRIVMYVCVRRVVQVRRTVLWFKFVSSEEHLQRVAQIVANDIFAFQRKMTRFGHLLHERGEDCEFERRRLGLFNQADLSCMVVSLEIG